MTPPEIPAQSNPPDDNNTGWVAIVIGIAIIGGVFAIGDWLSRQSAANTVVLNPRQFASATTSSTTPNSTKQILALTDCRSHFAADGTLVLNCPTDLSSSQVAGEQVKGATPTTTKPKSAPAASDLANWWQLLAGIFSLFNF